MKRLITSILVLALALTLCPSCFAQELIGKLGAGQLVNIDARNGLTYRVDFFLSSVDSVKRDAEDLIIEIDGGRLTLGGFFSDDREARQLLFADDSYISGSDFDENGCFTGELYRGADAAKENAEIRQLYSENPEAFLNCLVRRLPYGFEIIKDGYAVWGEEKQLMLAKYYSIFGEGDIDMGVNSTNELLLRQNADGTYTAVRQTLTTMDGFVITCNQPECLAIVSRALLVPLSESRVTVTYSNVLGETLLQLQAKIYDDNGTPAMSLVCPECGTDTGGEVHFLPCGHFACRSDFEAQLHAVGGCGLAGHCVSDGREHGICKNCQGYLCDGNQHGYGVCQHVHQWYTTSYTPGDANNPPHSTSVCFICGQTLYQ